MWEPGSYLIPRINDQPINLISPPHLPDYLLTSHPNRVYLNVAVATLHRALFDATRSFTLVNDRYSDIRLHFVITDTLVSHLTESGHPQKKIYINEQEGFKRYYYYYYVNYLEV